MDRFITDTLQKAGERLLQHQTWAIESAYNERSGNLLGSRRLTVAGSDFRFSHPIYERFLDIRARGRGKAKVERQIHNRFVYGTYLGISERLLYGFTKEIEEQFKAMDSDD